MQVQYTYIYIFNKKLSSVPEDGSVTICKSGFLDFVHLIYFNKITFRKLDLLPSSGKNKEQKP
jgi:hypothetical protein